MTPEGITSLGIKYATRSINSKKPDPDAYRERAGALSNLKRDKEALVDYDRFLHKDRQSGAQAFDAARLYFGKPQAIRSCAG